MLRSQFPSRNASCIALAFFDALSLFLVAALLTCAFVQPALAYVDPSVMTYTIQALAGVAVALSAVAGVALRRTRKVIFRMLKIDENANKEVDPNLVRVAAGDTATLNAADQAAREAVEISRKGRPAPKLSWKQRFLRALLVSFFACFTLLFVAPYETIVSNASEIVYGLDSIAPVLVALTLGVTIILAAALSAARGKAFPILLALVAAFGVGCWVQCMFLNTDLPTANGQWVDWFSYKRSLVFSVAAWTIIIVGAVVAAVKFRRPFYLGVTFVSCALIFVQIIGIASLPLPTNSSEDPNAVHMTQKGLFDVSSKSNVIVFCLDAADTTITDPIIEEYPELLNDFTGFTYFSDVVGSSIPTHYGVPFLLSGEYAQYDEKWVDYNNDRWNRSTLMDDVQNQGYSIGVYSDSVINGTSWLLEKSINVQTGVESNSDRESERAKLFDAAGAASIATKMALYRDVPWPAKQFFWYYTDQINQSMMKEQESDVTREEVENKDYIIDDVAYYNTLVDYGLEAGDEGETGAFRFIHLFGSHEPYNMNEYAEDMTGNPVFEGTSDTVTREQQTRGALYIVQEYINQLKELGLYEEATIIVTSDHGTNHVQMEPLDEAICSFLLVKPGNQTSEEASAQCAISHTQTGHMDIAAFIETSVGNYDSKYGTTTPFTVEDDERTRYFYMNCWDPHTDWAIREYVITGNSQDFSNWNLTGVYWDSDGWWHFNDAKDKTLDDIEFDMSGAIGPVVEAGPGSNITSGNPDCLKDQQ